MLLVRTEAPDFIDNGSNYGFGRSFTILPPRFDQTLLSEFLLRFVEGLVIPSLKSAQSVSTVKLAFFYIAIPFLEQAEHGGGGGKPF